MIRVGLTWFLLLALAAVHCVSLPPGSSRVRRFLDEERAVVVAHRGGTRLGPEHTLWTFGRAVGLGVDAIEMDVRQAAEGALVVIHDETVERTTEGRGEVAALTLSRLRAFDAGHRWSPDGGRTFPFRGKGLKIPTVEEVFSGFPRTPFVIEIKSHEPSAVRALCRTIRRFDMTERVLVAAFPLAPIKSFRLACPEVATAATAREVLGVWLLQQFFLPAFYRPPADELLVPMRFGGFRIVDAAFVKRARDHGMRVQVWTIHEPAAVERLVALGVGGIITEDPERVLAVLGRRG